MKHTDLQPSPDWSRSLTSTLAFVESRGVRIVGLVSPTREAGASLIGHELAAAYRSFGRRPFLFDPMTATRQAEPVDREGPSDWVSSLRDGFKVSLDEALASHDLVIMDLPPLSESARRQRSIFIAAGGLCDAALLVCETSAMARADLKRCLDIAKVCGIELAGIVLNDHKLPMSRFLLD